MTTDAQMTPDTAPAYTLDFAALLNEHVKVEETAGGFECILNPPSGSLALYRRLAEEVVNPDSQLRARMTRVALSSIRGPAASDIEFILQLNSAVNVLGRELAWYKTLIDAFLAVEGIGEGEMQRIPRAPETN